VALVDDEIRFFVEGGGMGPGPFTDDEVRDALRDGRLDPSVPVRLAGHDLLVPAHAWATFARQRTIASLPPPPSADGARSELVAALKATPASVRDMLLWCTREGNVTSGPFTGGELRRLLAQGRMKTALVAIVDTTDWYPVRLVFGAGAAPAEGPAKRAAPGDDGPLSAGRPPVKTDAPPPPSLLTTPPPREPLVRCPTCLEAVPRSAEICPHCDEPTGVLAPPSTSRPASIPADGREPSWFAMHWRPLVTLGAIAALVFCGIALRFLAPNRFLPERAMAARPAVQTSATCAPACWPGEACAAGKCTWLAPNDVGHLPDAPVVSGPFALPKDVSDVLPLDRERFMVAALAGLEIRDARTGEVQSLVSEVPQAKRLTRVGDVVYATGPTRVSVVDAQTSRLRKAIELGSPVASLAVGASGRRVLASLPSAHAVAILATEYHAEIDRILFGDDPVGPVGTDDTGQRALTTTGQVPLAGLRDPAGGAVYAFDPSRLASEQDRVRASMLGNPVSVLMAPDGTWSFVVLRAEDAIVPLEWLPSGAVGQRERLATCREPEQIELLRRDRRALVRCNEGRALDVVDLEKRKSLRRVGFNARAVDLAISPDGRQAVVALPGDGTGWVALVDLDQYLIKLVLLPGEPTRVRLAPDGTAALVFSDRSKAAWVLR
jgi:DNA-binding beta-propeller fold protein YncE